MRIPLLQKKKTKRTQALDAVASVAKAWGEWQLAKGAAKAAKRTPWKPIAAVGAGLAAAGIAAKKLLGGGKESDAGTPSPPPQYTGPVPDPNAPGAASGGTTPAPPRGPVEPSDAPGAGPIEGSGPGSSGTTGASPAAPVTPSAKPDPKAPGEGSTPET